MATLDIGHTYGPEPFMALLMQVNGTDGDLDFLRSRAIQSALEVALVGESEETVLSVLKNAEAEPGSPRAYLIEDTLSRHDTRFGQ